MFSSGGPTSSLLPPAAALPSVVAVLPGLPADWLPDAPPLADEGWLGLLAGVLAPGLELALVLVLPAELLELLLGGGALVGGGVGDDSGLVGVLAEGQPYNSRHRQAVPPMPQSRLVTALLNLECFNKFFRLYWLPRLKPRSECNSAQLPHQAKCLRVVFLVIVEALHVLHPAVLGDTERQRNG